MELTHNFDEMIERRGTDAKKYLQYPEDVLPILITAGSFILNAVMSITKSWSYPQYTAVLFCAGIVCGALYRKTPVQMAEEFAKGCQSMGFVVIIIGLGGAIARTLQQGNVLHTIVNWDWPMRLPALAAS